MRPEGDPQQEMADVGNLYLVRAESELVKWCVRPDEGEAEGREKMDGEDETNDPGRRVGEVQSVDPGSD